MIIRPGKKYGVASGDAHKHVKQLLSKVASGRRGSTDPALARYLLVTCSLLARGSSDSHFGGPIHTED